MAQLKNNTTIGGNAFTVGTAAYFVADGSLGIGTSTPSAKLHVYSGDALINTLTVGLGSGGNASNMAFGYRALYSNTSGITNHAFGFLALQNNTTGTSNQADGYLALYQNTTGSVNLATGFRALWQNTAGGVNLATGISALGSNTTGSYNQAVGHYALQNNTTGNYNQADGYRALYQNTTGNNNHAVGYIALQDNTIGSNNHADGYNALLSTTTCVATLGTITGGSGYTNGTYYNVSLQRVSGSYAQDYGKAHITIAGGAVTQVNLTNFGRGYTDATTVLTANNTNLGGTGSGFSVPVATLSTGEQNIGVGYQAGYYNKTGDNNHAIGYQALYNNFTGSDNTAIGYQALYSSTISNQNFAIGHQASYSITSYTFTLGIATAGSGYTDGTYNNVQLSYYSGPTLTSYPTANITVSGGQVTSITQITAGYGVKDTSTILTTSSSNIGVTGSGFTARLIGYITPGITHAVGYKALYNNLVAGNHAFGYMALYSNTTGLYNHAIGYVSLYSNTTGNYNYASGIYSMYYNTTGSYNQAEGSYSLWRNTTGSYNQAAGYYALIYNTTGNLNVAFGYYSGNAITTGSNNTVIGPFAGSNITIGGNNTVLGGYTGLTAPISKTGNNWVVLSDGAGTVRQVIDPNGNVGVGTTAPTSMLHVIGTANISTSTASTSTITGAIVTAGGVGIGGALNVGGSIYSAGVINSGGAAIHSSITSNGAISGTTITGSTGFEGGYVSGTVFNARTSAVVQSLSSNTTITAGTGLTVTTGGANITGNLTVSGNIILGGNINVNNSNVLVTDEPIIYVGDNNPANLWDLGIVGSYNSGTYKHTGFLRNKNDGVWTIFDNLITEPSQTITWSQTGLTYGSFKTGNINVAATTSSTSTTTGAIITAGGVGIAGNLNVGGTVTLSTALGVASGGTGLTSLTAGYIPYGNGTSAFSSSSNFTYDGTNVVSSGASVARFRLANSADTADFAYSGSNLYLSNNSSGGVLILQTANTERMRIDSNGNVAIGTTSFLAGGDMEIRRSAATVNLDLYSTNNTGTVKLRLYNNVNQGAIGYTSDYALAFYNNSVSTERMRIDSSGQVGIGSSSPAKLLDIAGDTRIRRASAMSTQYLDITLGAGGTYFNASSGSGALNFSTNGGSSVGLILDGSHNVGIGTTLPFAPLELYKDQNTDTFAYITNINSGVSARAGLGLANDHSTGVGYIYATGANYTGVSGWADALVVTSSSGLAGGLFLNAQAGNVKIATGATTRVTINSNGNVGINTTSVVSTLQVFTNGSYAYSGLSTLSNAGLHLTSSNTTTGYAGQSIVWSNYGTGGTAIQAYISAATYGDNYLSLSANGTTEHIRVNSTGIISTSSAAVIGGSTITGQATLTVNGNISLPSNSGAKIAFNTNDNFTSTSSVTTAHYGLTYQSAGTNTVGISGYSGLMFYSLGAERMRIDSSGQVGIGTASPATKFHVYSGAVNTAYRFDVSSTSYTNQIQFNRGTGNDIYIGPTSISTFDLWSYESLPLRIGLGNSERMRIDSSGGVGIGTITPSATLHVSNATANPLAILEATGTQDTAFWFNRSGVAKWYMYNDNSTNGLNFGNPSINPIMKITSGGNIQIGTSGTGYIGRLVSVTNNATIASADLRSTASGDVGNRSIFISKFDNNTTTSQIFIQFAINNAATGSGQINANGASAAAFGTYSDARLKENITNLSSQLGNILALKPSEFDYLNGSGHQIGFIAQEMQEVYPDVVGEDTDGMLTVTGWSKTEARLVSAIQGLNAKLEALMTEFEEYKRTHP